MPAASCWDTGSNTEPDPGSANAAGTTAEGGTSIPAPPAIWTAGVSLTGGVGGILFRKRVRSVWRPGARRLPLSRAPLEAEEEEVRGSVGLTGVCAGWIFRLKMKERRTEPKLHAKCLEAPFCSCGAFGGFLLGFSVRVPRSVSEETGFWIITKESALSTIGNEARFALHPGFSHR